MFQAKQEATEWIEIILINITGSISKARIELINHLMKIATEGIKFLEHSLKRSKQPNGWVFIVSIT